jgi:predicted lipid-binding transport protein (Tim44 family)
MALSEREQKLIEELERGLLDGDSGLDSKAKRLGNPAGRLIGGALVAVIGVIVLLTAVLAQIALIGVAGFLIMLAGLVIATSNLQLPNISADFAKAAPGSPKPGRNFFEDRWDKRQGD